MFLKASHAIQWRNGEPATSITPEQRAAVHVVAERYNLPYPVIVDPLFAGDKGITVAAGGMVLGIEPDGYTHS